MAHTPAFERFIASLAMDFDKWHDGIGIDIDAISEMTDAERDEAALIVKRRRPVTWREIEALTILDPLAAERLAGEVDDDDEDPDEDPEAATEEMFEPPAAPGRDNRQSPYSPAYRRFNAHMEANLGKWKDGEGYDLAALAGMNDPERKEIAHLLATRGEITWREVEVLAALDLPETRGEIDKALAHHLSIDTRLAAAEALFKLQRLPDIDGFLARQIRNISTMQNGGVRALAMAEAHPTEKTKQALLWASWNQTECAPHFAALLCFLCGKAKEKFDWELRPMLLKLDLYNSYFDRKKAFDELCKLVGMEIDHSQVD